MSVLVKGMEMPKNCYVCEFITFDGGWICKRLKRKIINVGNCNPKDKNCPLVEVSVPHGRLIDGDAIRANYSAYDCLYYIYGVPTVIEAEWGEDE